METPKVEVWAGYSLDLKYPTHSVYWYNEYVGEETEQTTAKLQIPELTIAICGPEGTKKTIRLRDVEIKGDIASVMPRTLR